MHQLSQLPLLGVYALPVMATVAGIGFLLTVILRSRSIVEMLRRGLIAASIGAALVVLGWAVIEKLWKPFPDPLHRSIYLFVAVALATIAAALLPRFHHWWHTVVALLLSLVVVAAAAAHVNALFGTYPTVGTLFRPPVTVRVSAAELPPPATAVTHIPVAPQWTPPADMPSTGAVVEVPIPGTLSGFAARPAQVYIPPAYRTATPPALPVVLLLAGQPGSPTDWLQVGNLQQIMDTFAAAHEGLSPIIVVADPTGTPLNNTLCVDSPAGNADTYLTKDVPAAITAQFATLDRPWAVAGLSFGGTCALQLATGHPDQFPIFVDMSGQAEPTLGDRATTIAERFGGDEAAFHAANPTDRLTTRRYEGLHGTFIVGANDADAIAALSQQRTLADAAGITTQWMEYPGGHSYEVWRAGLADVMPWLSQQLGLTTS